MPQLLIINHRLSAESNAFSKSMKLTYNDYCHSIDCSMIFLNMKICSVVPLPGRKPDCSCLSFDSTPIRILSITILPMTLLTTDSSVIPRQFLHSFRFPFFDSLTISPFLHFLTHVQYTQTDTIRQNTLTNGTIGKRLRFVKETLRFVPLERMVSSSVDR